MRYVKVQYDAYNRQFKVADGELSAKLDDGGIYLVADFSREDSILTDLEILETFNAPS